MLIPALFALSFLSQWTPAASPVKASLRGLHAANATVIWASGSDATVLRSIDAGASWHALAVPGSEGLDFRDIQAFDAKTAVVMSAGPGAKSRIYRTGDGGAHWTLARQNQHEKGFFDSIAFWDRQRGILVGDPVDGRFEILLTGDGGVTWKPAGGPPANEGEGAFAASGTSIATGQDGRAWFGTGGEKGGRVFVSNDGGQTWRAIQTPIRHDSASAGIFSIVFQPDAQHGFAAGGDYRKPAETAGTLIATADGGLTWTPVSGLGGYRSAIAAQGKMLIATGPDGSDVSRDGGKTWSPIAAPGFHALGAAKGAKGKIWASGAGGRISKRSE